MRGSLDLWPGVMDCRVNVEAGHVDGPLGAQSRVDVAVRRNEDELGDGHVAKVDAEGVHPEVIPQNRILPISWTAPRRQSIRNCGRQE